MYHVAFENFPINTVIRKRLHIFLMSFFVNLLSSETQCYLPLIFRILDLIREESAAIARIAIAGRRVRRERESNVAIKVKDTRARYPTRRNVPRGGVKGVAR